MSRFQSSSENLSSELEYKVIELVNAQIPFKQDCYNNKSIKFFIVEGGQDARFFEQVFNGSNKFISVKDLSDVSKDLKGKDFRVENSRDEITKFIFISSQEKTFWENNNIYCIIDRDFDNPFPWGAFKRFFSNDTHDLETMLVYSDNELIGRVFPFDDEKIKSAMFMAYQIGVVKETLSKKHIQHSSYTISKYFEWKKCFEEKRLNVEKFVNMLNDREKIFSETKKQKPKLINFKELSLFLQKNNKPKNFDKNNNFVLSFEAFRINLPVDFYEIVNGHDLMNCLILNYENDPKIVEISKVITDKLIEKYNFNRFKETYLYAQLSKNSLL